MEKHRDKDPELPDFIKSLKDENPFIVPHNYFRELPDEILRRVEAEDRDKPVSPMIWADHLRSWSRLLLAPRPAVALAAILVLLGGLFWWPDSNQPVDEQLVASAEEQAELVEYIKQHLDEFDESDFYSDDAAVMEHPLYDDLENQDMRPYLDEIIDDVEIEELEDLL